MRIANAVGPALRHLTQVSVLPIISLAICAAAFALVPLASGRLAHAAPATPTKYLVYIGTYTTKDDKPTDSQGIYGFRFDTASGEIEELGAVADSEQPSFLASDPGGNFLYAVNEVDTLHGQSSGGVSAFAIDKTSGHLSFLNQVPSQGGAPAHVAVDHTGKYVAVSNYDGGSIAVFPVMQDGHLGAATAFVQHHGSSLNKDRQTGPHVHQVIFSPDNRFALSTDLGLDELFVYSFDAKTGTFGPQPRVLQLTPGFGPRHIAFSPPGNTVYLISELSSTVSVLPYETETGALEIRDSKRLAPAGDAPAKKWAAEIAVSPSGKYVYASNRGDDFIGVFSVDPGTDMLSRTETVPLFAKTPRNFAIEPSGQWLWDANQDSDNIFLYRIDPQNGGLIPSGVTLKVASPTCVLFVPVQ